MVTRAFLDSLVHDFIYAWRQIRLSPGFTAVAVLTLALGIGVNTSIFSLLNALLLRPLPVPEPSRLVTLFRGDSRPCSYPDYLDFRDHNRVFSGLAADLPNETALDTGESSEVTLVESVSYNFADVLRTEPVLGRWFSSDDERRAPGEFVAVISYRIWQSRFAGSPGVLGKQVRLESQPYTVIGVAAKDLQGMSQPILTDLWVPIAAYSRHNQFAADAMRNRLAAKVMLIGRLNAGTSPEIAQAAMNVIDHTLQHDYSRSKSHVEPLRAEVARGVSDPGNRRAATAPVALLMAVVAMVLLIACANIANLLLAHGIMRRREMAIRVAVGASRLRIVRQCLVESLLLALLGTAFGVLAAYWTNRYLEAKIAAAPGMIAVGAALAIDWRVLAFAFGATLLTTLVFGIVPAIQASKPDLIPALKGENSADHSRHHWFRLRNLYVLAQVTVSLMLLIVSGLFIRALHNASGLNPGFDAGRVLSVRLYLAKPDFAEPAGIDLYNRALDLVRALPGVRNATLSYASPSISSSECVAVPSRGGEARALTAGSNIVGTHYFATLGVPLLAGRDFTRADGPGAPEVVIVNDVLARSYFRGQNPIGMRVRVGRGCERAQGSEAEIIGVARDARYATLEPAAKPYVFFPVAQRFAGYTALLVRTEGAPTALGGVVRKKLLDLDNRLRIYEVIGLQEQMDESLWLVRWEAALVTAFGGLALVLAAVGLYGVIASTVSQRTSEIGIRMALGAHPGQILRLVIANALGMTGVGVALGLVASLALTGLLRGFLFGLSPTDPGTFGGAVLLWIAIASLASYVPARRAARTNPLETLRHQ
jgi:predicted permease